MRISRLRRHAALSALALVTSIAGIASAAQISLNNTRVHLDGTHPVETLVLTNQESEPLDMEVKVQRWQQGADGKWQLQPDAGGLVVHPLILTMQPNGEARLRVGTISPNVTSEIAYRIEVQELPGRKQVQAGAVRMLTKLSIPVFVQPPKAKAALSFTVDSVDGKGTLLDIRNTGTGFSGPSDANVRVLDANNRVLQEGHVTVGYVLAGARLPTRVALKDSVCAHAAHIEVKLTDSAPMTADVAPGARRCAP